MEVRSESFRVEAPRKVDSHPEKIRISSGRKDDFGNGDPVDISLRLQGKIETKIVTRSL